MLFCYIIHILDLEPPVFTYCPSDILVVDLTENEVRVNWNRPVATDNSGVLPTLDCNYLSGERFSVPGVYEVVCTAVDESQNIAKCAFRITLQRK